MVGVTSTLIAPVAGSGVTGPTSAHEPPDGLACRTTFVTPRTVPVRVTSVPAATATFGEGGSSESTPTLNHVERRLSAPATVPPVTTESDGLPWATVVTSSFATRFEWLRLTVASTGLPVSASAAARSLPVTGIGPQEWYGEIVSYGSFTETRYGAPPPQASAADCVRPPVLEE